MSEFDPGSSGCYKYRKWHRRWLPGWEKLPENKYLPLLLGLGEQTTHSLCVELEFSLRMRALVQHGPVAVSVSAGPSRDRDLECLWRLSQQRGADSWDLYLQGIFDYCSKDVIIDHAVTLTGYGKDSGFGFPNVGV